ncbi:MAG: tRNA 2-thiouridine(34) synthase MnmA [Firmicutes bacterium]|nr:tRNA 2-thiouridine(34) synthase MnmA [Bacillota bacterium]
MGANLVDGGRGDNSKDNRESEEGNKRVVVAMSGGVDSSIAAALLKERGYDVIGVTMQIWPRFSPDGGAQPERSCCSLAAVEDARRVANRLGIPYYVFNLQEDFSREVIDYFCSEYIEGRTPNPCVVCNTRIKFGLLLHKARALGASHIATGHYARICYDPSMHRYILKKARDRHKDQTYVLYNLTQDQLASTIMPLGEFTKDETRALAAKLGFKVANKPDSQEICFIPDNDYRRFLAERVPESVNPGPILDVHGNVLGEHRGIAFYTIGQRKGLGISAREPLYVIALDRERNAVIVGAESEIYSRSLIAGSLNWIAFEDLSEAREAWAKIRYYTEPAHAVVTPLAAGDVEVRFAKPQRAVTPGQSCVFYDGDVVLGGGIIEAGQRWA